MSLILPKLKLHYLLLFFTGTHKKLQPLSVPPPIWENFLSFKMIIFCFFIYTVMYIYSIYNKGGNNIPPRLLTVLVDFVYA